jgi:hypothetical protein
MSDDVQLWTAPSYLSRTCLHDTYYGLNTHKQAANGIDMDSFETIGLIEVLLRPDVLLEDIVQCVVSIGRELRLPMARPAVNEVLLLGTPRRSEDVEEKSSETTSSSKQEEKNNADVNTFSFALSSITTTLSAMSSSMTNLPSLFSTYDDKNVENEEWDLLTVSVALHRTLKQRVLLLQFMKEREALVSLRASLTSMGAINNEVKEVSLMPRGASSEKYHVLNLIERMKNKLWRHKFAFSTLFGYDHDDNNGKAVGKNTNVIDISDVCSLPELPANDPLTRFLPLLKHGLDYHYAVHLYR